MNIHKENINQLWASLIVEELIRNGVNYFCISPGSRSTPLITAVARNPQAKYIIAYDERAAGYHALGFARATNQPAVIISTSGTAVANYFPAVVESSFDLIPLIVLSADRPPELRATGANQTIQQPRIFGDYVRWHFDLSCPTDKISPETVLTTVDQAIYRSKCNPSGPVHINCQFREPLAPKRENIASSYLNSIKSWLKVKTPYTSYTDSIMELPPKDRKKLSILLSKSKKGILVVGHLRSSMERDAIISLAKKLRWPVFADILSGLRLGNHFDDLVTYYDQLLLLKKFEQELQPELILQVGGQITSKRWLQFIEKYAPKNYILVTNHPFRFDPAHKLSWRIEANLVQFCKKMETETKTSIDLKWKNRILEKSNIVEKILNEMVQDNIPISEPSVARILSKEISIKQTLFVASSLPIREMDMFAKSNDKVNLVKSNRGASGIDGTIASATGFVKGSDRPVTLLIGDLAFIHDLNSLSLVKNMSETLIIILLNNQGGGIFSFLPISQYPDVFETFFGTPHQMTFKHAAELFELDYSCPGSNREFRTAYRKAQRSDRSTIIEIQTNRDHNFALHKEIQNKILKVLDS